MKIIIPKKKSAQVESFSQIKEAAIKMQEALEKDDFPRGPFNKTSIALHHSQVDSEPFNFFVLKRVPMGAKRNELIVIVNPEIIFKVTNTKCTHGEGCISFPFRQDKHVTRYEDIKVRYQMPHPDGKTLISHEERLQGMMAFIFQHEIDHAKGINIY